MPVGNSIHKYTTTVLVSKTMGEVMRVLAKNGATHVTASFDDEGEPNGMSFLLNGREYALPIRKEGILAFILKDKSLPASKRNAEQANRIAWRIAYDLLLLQIALIDAEMSTFDEVMFPYMLDSSRGHTLYQAYSAKNEVEQ